MKLICLTGIDGAGKTTLARNLAAALGADGGEAYYIYGRTYPIVSRLLMALGRKTLLRKQNLWSDYRAYNSDKKKAMRNPILRWLYIAAILIDYLPQIWWKLAPNMFSNRTIILDRYVYDTVISDLTVHLGFDEKGTEQWVRVFFAVLPTPALTAVIDLPVEVAFARKDDVPHCDYLAERRSWYLQLLQRPEAVRIDGENLPGDIVRQVLTLVERKVTGP